MKTSFKNISAALLAGTVLVAGVTATIVNAESLTSEERIKPSIPFTKIIEIVSNSAQGEIITLELDHYDNSPVYVAEIEGEASHTVMRIDGDSGEVLATSTTTGSSAEALHAMLEEADHQEHSDGDDHSDDDHGDEVHGSEKHGDDIHGTDHVEDEHADDEHTADEHGTDEHGDEHIHDHGGEDVHADNEDHGDEDVHADNEKHGDES